MRVIRASAAPALGVALALGAIGCGAERSTRSDLSPSGSAPVRRLDYRRVGMRLSVPRIAAPERRPPPRVFRISFGEAFAAAYAFRRSEQLPRTGAELATARRLLLREVRRRDRRFRLIRARLTRVDGAPAIELVGDQTMSRTRLRTRSVHVFKGHVEYVLEMFAPVPRFALASRNTFDRMVRSLRLTGRIRRARR